MLKMAIITGFLSKTKDRFHDYNQPLDLDEKFALMTAIEGYDGVEIVYPYEVSDPQATRTLLEKHALQVAAVNVNVKAEPEFRNGGLTASRREVREKAVRFIKEAKDFAAAIGADKVTAVRWAMGMNSRFSTIMPRPGNILSKPSAKRAATKRRFRFLSSTNPVRRAVVVLSTPLPRPCVYSTTCSAPRLV